MDAAAAPPEPLTPPPLSRAWWQRFETPYMTVSLVAVAFAAVLAARRPWGVDFWVHATAVDRLGRDLLDPGGLHIAQAGSESSYYSPYTVVVALVTQVSGASAVTALSLMAPVTMALLCFGFYRFVRLFHSGTWFPVFALAVVVTLWGIDMWAWSGFLSVYSIPVTLPLPSILASSLMFLVWTMLVRALADPRAWRWTGIASLATLIVLTHQLTALNTAIGCVAIAIWRLDKLDSRVMPGLLAGLGASLALVISWPYYSVVSLLGSTAVDGSHEVLYSQVWLYQGLIVVAVPALWLRFRRDRRDVLVWMAVISLGFVGVGWLIGHYTYARTLTPLMLAGQLALVLEIYRLRGIAIRSKIWTSTTAAVCVTAFVLNCGNLLYVLPPSGTLDRVQFQLGRNPVPPDYGWLGEFASTGDTVVTDNIVARRIVTARGVYTVTPGWPDPVVTGTGGRTEAVVTFFSGDSAHQRADIVARYNVDWVLDVPGGPAYDSRGDGVTLAAVGPRDQRLYRVGG